MSFLGRMSTESLKEDEFLDLDFIYNNDDVLKYCYCLHCEELFFDCVCDFNLDYD